MTGFVRRKSFELRWDGGDGDEFDGLVVTMARASVATMLELRVLLDPSREMEDVAQANAELERACELLAEHLLDWNLQGEDGEPVPCTLAGVRAQDRALLAEILTMWRRAVEGLRPPLPRPSTVGERSAEASIPMEPLSSNPPS